MACCRVHDLQSGNVGKGCQIVALIWIPHHSTCSPVRGRVHELRSGNAGKGCQFVALIWILPLPSNWDSLFFSQFFSHATEASHNQNKNLLSTTCSVLSPTVVRFKGSLIYPLVGSCSGYGVIPYFRGLDRCSWRYIDPASKNAGFLLARTA
jgi:hypothetical protein